VEISIRYFFSASNKGTYSVLRAEPHTVRHADAMSKRIDPDFSKLVVLGVEETCKSVIGALDEIAIPLVFGILEKVLVVGGKVRPEEVQSLLQVDERLAHVVAHQWFAQNESEEISSRYVPSKRVLSAGFLGSWNV
jgi:hypothetical protein